MDYIIKQNQLFTKAAKLKRSFLVFISSFIIIFLVLNFGTIYGQVSSRFESKPDEEANNLQLENFYKNKYSSLNYLLSSQENKISSKSQSQTVAKLNLPPALTIEKSLNSIGEATLELNKTIPTHTPVISQTINVANTTVNKNNISTDKPVIQTSLVNSNYVSIPKLNIKALVIQPPSNEKQILNSLKSGVVLYPGSALPGQAGTSVIIGHSSSNFPITKYSAIFAGLNKLSIGDLIYISYGGKNYTYIIKDKKIGSSAQLTASLSNNDLVLGTCWPIGTDKNRIIVAANLQ